MQGSQEWMGLVEQTLSIIALLAIIGVAIFIRWKVKGEKLSKGGGRERVHS